MTARKQPKNRKSAGEIIACAYFNWKLFQRDGVWYADGRGNRPNLGKHSLGTRDREEALQTLRRLDHAKAVALGKVKESIPAPESRLSIADGWKLFDEQKALPAVMGGVSDSTRKRYRPVRDYHLEFCARRGIDYWDQFTLAEYQEYGRMRNKNTAERTFYLELSTLKGVVNLLIEKNRLPASCRIRAKLSKTKGTDRYCYRRAEVRAMLEHCAADPDLHWLGLVILGLAFTGMRIEELAGLRWSDIDEGLTVIRIADERASRVKREAGTARTTKGKSSRSVPIHPKLQAALQSLDRSRGGFIFRAPRGGKLRSRNTLQQFISKVIEPLSKRFPTPEGEIGFGHGRLHSFRHFFISRTLIGGATEGEVREWVGHSNSRIIEHYRKLHAEDAQRRMRTLDLLGSAAESSGPADVTPNSGEQE